MTDKDFHSPASIVFSQEQVVWLIKHLAIIRTGCWPSDHKETGYTGSKKRTINHRAYFETPVSIAAELDHRLESVGIDGILLEFAYSSETDDRLQLEQHLATAMRLDLDTIDRRIEQALRYCCGYRRKQRSYKAFRNHKGKGG